MNKQFTTSPNTIIPDKVSCAKSLLIYCGLESTHSLLDGQEYQFQKRKKISLKNRQVKNINNSTAFTHSSPSRTHPAGSHLKQVKTQSKYLHGQQMTLTPKDFTERSDNYIMVTSTQGTNRVQKEQNKKQDPNYEEQFQKILFFEDKDGKSQSVQNETSYIFEEKGKRLNSFHIKQSQSVLSQDQNCKLSILLPYSPSLKLTSSTFFQTKTSHSIIFPSTNHHQTSFAVSEAISDEQFKRVNFVDPFKSPKSRLCA